MVGRVTGCGPCNDSAFWVTLDNIRRGQSLSNAAERVFLSRIDPLGHPRVDVRLHARRCPAYRAALEAAQEVGRAEGRRLWRLRRAERAQPPRE